MNNDPQPAEDKTIMDHEESHYELLALNDPKILERLRSLALDLNGGWVPEWHCQWTHKYYLNYSVRSSELFVHYDFVDVSLGTVYFKDEATAVKALEIILTWGLCNHEQ